MTPALLLGLIDLDTYHNHRAEERAEQDAKRKHRRPPVYLTVPTAAQVSADPAKDLAFLAGLEYGAAPPS